MEEYRCTINYHPGKANVVADALSRKVRVASIRVKETRKLQKELLNDLAIESLRLKVCNLSLRSDLTQEIKQA